MFLAENSHQLSCNSCSRLTRIQELRKLSYKLSLVNSDTTLILMLDQDMRVEKPPSLQLAKNYRIRQLVQATSEFKRSFQALCFSYSGFFRYVLAFLFLHFPTKNTRSKENINILRLEQTFLAADGTTEM